MIQIPQHHRRPQLTGIPCLYFIIHLNSIGRSPIKLDTHDGVLVICQFKQFFYRNTKQKVTVNKHCPPTLLMDFSCVLLYSESRMRELSRERLAIQFVPVLTVFIYDPTPVEQSVVPHVLMFKWNNIDTEIVTVVLHQCVPTDFVGIMLTSIIPHVYINRCFHNDLIYMIKY